MKNKWPKIKKARMCGHKQSFNQNSIHIIIQNVCQKCINLENI